VCGSDWVGELPEGTVVDGETVALDKSRRPNFNVLQNWMRDASLRKLYWDMGPFSTAVVQRQFLGRAGERLGELFL
jgi:hypothetical protein